MAKPINITCPEHGIWSATPNNLLKKKGCRQCGTIKQALKRRLSTKTWIETARKVHGYKYQYHKANYVTAKTPIELVCRKHGSFMIRPDNHISKQQGCKKCSGKSGSGKNKQRKQRIDQAEFLRRAKNAHPHRRYDFSESYYTGIANKVSVICFKHGSFEILPQILNLVLFVHLNSFYINMYLYAFSSCCIRASNVFIDSINKGTIC